MIEKFEELKPCPFCGWKNIIIGEMENGRLFVRCGCCGAEITRKNKEDLKKAWEKRSN